MELSVKAQIITLLAVATVAYAAGLHNTPKSIESSKEEEVKRETNTHEVVETVQLTSGEIHTTKTTDRSSTTDKTKKEDKRVVSQASKINISALVAKNLRNNDEPILYGVSVSKEVAGPITAGIFGLSNGTVGLSLGINF